MAFSLFRNRGGGLAALLALALVALPLRADAFDKAQRGEIEQIIHDYLLANPQVMLEVQDALQKQQQAQRVAAREKTLSEQRDAIYHSPDQVEIGNPQAKVTVVEFFDYNCHFCQRALDDMNRLVGKNDTNVRFVLKEFPILGPQSVAAHKVAVAFTEMMPEKAAEFHRTLLAMKGVKDGNSALDVAVKLGADRAKLKAASEKPAIMATIGQSLKLGDALDITGTPSYVIGNEVVPGAIGYDGLSAKIASVADCGKTSC